MLRISRKKFKQFEERIEEQFEIVNYFIVFFVIMFSSLIPAVNSLLLISTVIGIVILNIIGYRLMPAESTGKLTYTFQQKKFVIISLNIILITLLIGATGATYSPFIILFLFPIMEMTVFLHRRQVYMELVLFFATYSGMHFIEHGSFNNNQYLLNVIIILLAFWLASVLVTFDDADSEVAIGEAKKKN